MPVVQYFRDICLWKLLQVPVRLGGLGLVVQMDESVITRTKYNHDSKLFVRTKWTYSVYDPVFKVGYAEMVPNRSAQTLQRII